MNAQIKEAWLTALRSGAYKQGRGQLHVEDTFCCLGVLCDLHAKDGLGQWIDDGDAMYKYIGDMQLPPIQVMRWAELPSVNPSIDGTALTNLNDGIEGYDDDAECDVILEEPLSFAEIADLIERYL